MATHGLRFALLACWFCLASSLTLVSGCGGTASPGRPPAPAPAMAASAEPPPADEEPDPGPEGPLQARPELTWWHESMKGKDARLGWWREARFGMFVHWGVYSALGGVWDGQPVKGYAEHIQRIRKIPVPVYRDRVAAAFNPTEFDADAWIGAAKRAGMGYFIITAKHHDGFAMYDSAVSNYNVVKATAWKRDPMLALKTACARQGLRFGFYYSHAFDWGEADGAGNDWDYQNPGGDRLLHGGRDWWKAAPQLRPQLRRYVDGKAIPQLKELIARYDPDILWFDTPHKLPPDENLRILQAVRAAKPTVVVNGRILQATPGGPRGRFGDYASTADRPAEFPPSEGDWEAIPTTNESYGWHRMDTSHKTPGHFVQLLAKATARGGNVLLNVGPMGDGQLDPRDLGILEGLAVWMKKNRESVIGTVRTPLPVQPWGESTRGTGKHHKLLYLHVLRWPQDGRLVVAGLTSPVRGARFLAERRRRLTVRRAGPRDLVISVPRQPPDAADTVIALELVGEPVVDPVRRLGPEVGTDELRAFDGKIAPGMAFGAGKVRDAWAHRWTRPDQAVRWPVRLDRRQRFAVAVAYDAPATSAGGTFAVDLGPGQQLTGTVTETPKGPVPLGQITMEPGQMEIAIRPVVIKGQELLRLRSLYLTAVAEK
jgi:alpha-L-fucosidase